MRHLRELIAAIQAARPADNFFSEFETGIAQNALKRKHFAAYERALRCLDDASWENLRTKAVAHFHESRHRQQKAPFFDQLNDVFAYRWLIQQGFSGVTVLPENRRPRSGEKCPDLAFFGPHKRFACDVKTIGVSDAELDRRQSAPKYYDSSMYKALAPGFFRKIDDAIVKGTEQVRQYAEGGLVFIVVHNDDITSSFHADHRTQITRHLQKHSVPVVVKFGVCGQHRIERVASLFGNNAA